MKQYTLFICIVLACIYTSSSNQTLKSVPVPSFPATFSASIQAYSSPSRYYKFDLFFDSKRKAYRLDSYGVPQFLKRRVPPQFQSNSLYQFFFMYNVSQPVMVSLFPNPEGKGSWNCFEANLPVNAMLPSWSNLEVITKSSFIDMDPMKKVAHFQKDMLFFTVDYFQHIDLGIPMQILASGDEFSFYNVQIADTLNATVFQFPPNTNLPCDKGF